MTLKAIARTLLFLLLLPIGAAFAQSTSTNKTLTFANSWFFDQQGNTGIVSVVREPDPTTGQPFTQLFYSFCVETEAAQCQEGTGIIPNATFQGQIHSKHAKDTLTLLADTTVPGFQNWLCITPNYDTASCGSTAPATGGLIQVTFVKTFDVARVTTSQDHLYQRGILASSDLEGTWLFSDHMTGTVLGLPANTQGITAAVLMLDTSATTSTVVAAAKAGTAAKVARAGTVPMLPPVLKARIQEWLGARAVVRLTPPLARPSTLP